MNAGLLLTMAVALGAPCSPDLLRAAGFVPGPYAVGFRPERLNDATRPWPSAADPSGARGRPVQVALWYPAEPADGDGISVEDLVLADATGVLDASRWDAARPAALAAARAVFDAGAERPLTDAEWLRARGLPSRARAGAPALPGRRALLLLEGGLATPRLRGERHEPDAGAPRRSQARAGRAQRPGREPPPARPGPGRGMRRPRFARRLPASSSPRWRWRPSCSFRRCCCSATWNGSAR
jgi:hypothetical protein